MKKSTQLKNWFERKLTSFFGTEKPDPEKNIQEIMNLLFYSNFSKLPTTDSLYVYETVKEKFSLKIDAIDSLNKKEAQAIQKFKEPTIKEKVLEHISNTAFDRPVIVEFPDLPNNFPFEPMSAQEMEEYLSVKNEIEVSKTDSPVNDHPNIEVLEFNKI